MKNFVALLALLMLSTLSSRAQGFFSVQWEIAEPTESFRDVAGTGKGVQAKYIHFINPRFNLSANIGYIEWGPRTATPPSENFKFSAIPIHVGASILLSKDVVAPYVGLSLGMNYLRTKGVPPNAPQNGSVDKSELKFGFTTHVGLGVRLVGRLGLVIDGLYNVVYTRSPSKYFGLDVGLVIGF